MLKSLISLTEMPEKLFLIRVFMFVCLFVFLIISIFRVGFCTRHFTIISFIPQNSGKSQ